MASARTAELINDFLGSTHVFASSVNDVIEERLLREVGPPQLTFSQFKLLKLVALTDAQTIGDVAAFLRVSNAAASKAVDKLVRQGLLVRKEAQSDRRAIQLSLTASSRQVLAAYNRRRTESSPASSASSRRKTCNGLLTCWTALRPASWTTRPGRRRSACSAASITARSAW